MSFNKRSVPLRRAATPSAGPASLTQPNTPGVRPSPVTGQPTISTGCGSLDTLLAANAGLILGQSLLIEETGTTDYSSALLRCFAAEGLLQGHQVHVVGVGEPWGKDLPGTFEDPRAARAIKEPVAPTSAGEAERMKIAWRYERMGTHGERPQAPQANPSDPTLQADIFCHAFDFTKRLTLPPSSKPIRYINLSPRTGASPFEAVLANIKEALSKGGSNVVHRVVIPSILSPAFYPPHASLPNHVLAFLQSMRALLRQYSTRLSLMLSLPLSLHPRASGLTRWMERLVDGVIELAPFPHTFDVGRVPGAGGKEEEKPQGMVRVHALPVFTERGGGEGKGIAGGGGDDLCFVVSRRKFLVRAFDLPPVEGDTDAQKGDSAAGANSMEF